MSKKEQSITASKGSVFDDLNLPTDQRVKADIAMTIEQRIKELGLTQTIAAEQMGIKQPDLSNILRGRFRGYSVERMMGMLGSLACDVHIVIHPHGAKKDQAKIIPMAVAST